MDYNTHKAIISMDEYNQYIKLKEQKPEIERIFRDACAVMFNNVEDGKIIDYARLGMGLEPVVKDIYSFVINSKRG